MKKMLLISIMLMAVLSANAQSSFVCTGNNVNLRTGPGRNYQVVIEDYGNKVQLFKGDVITNLGQKKNGFCKVSVYVYRSGDYVGWVPAQYLKPVRKCSRCDGSGQVGDGMINRRTCPKCNGRGY